MRIYLDATTLIALGTVGELHRLSTFDGALVVLPEVQSEVTTEPARENLRRFVAAGHATTAESTPDVTLARARTALDETGINGDVRLIAAVLAATDGGDPVAVVSDDRRVRHLAAGFGAHVTGTVGVLVNAVRHGFDPNEAKSLVRRIDDHGLHMTGALRERADELIDGATRP